MVARTRPSPDRRCSVTSCCARPSPRTRPKKAGHPLAHELALLTVHGVLHLLGYDHAEPEEEKEMFGLQNQLLEEWFEDCAGAEREAALAARDQKLLGKAGFFDAPDQ